MHLPTRFPVPEREQAVEKEKAELPSPVRVEPATPQEEKSVAPESLGRRQPLLWGAPEKRPVILSKAKVKRKPPATKASDSILRERIHKFGVEGWTPRIQDRKFGKILTFRKRVDGKRVEKYIGTYDENTKKFQWKRAILSIERLLSRQCPPLMSPASVPM